MPVPGSILFDLDNTLNDRSGAIDRYCQVFLDEFGSQLLGESDLASLLAEADQGGYSETRPADICRLLPWRSIPTPEAIHSHWRIHFPRSTVPCSGLIETLEFMRRQQIKLAIVTNGGLEGQKTKIGLLGIQDFFDTVVISGAVGFGKPDRRIFELALSEIGSQAQQAWFVGDHPRNDILGAESAGLTPIWMSGRHPWPSEVPEPQMQISALPELVALIEAAASRGG